MPRFFLPSRLPVDPYVLALLGTVALASVLPATGLAADAVGTTATWAVALLFFLYGARTSPREAVDGLRHWRLHSTVLLTTFGLFPLLGIAALTLPSSVLSAELGTGLLFLCLLPSTVQSAITFTSIARGNVVAAVCSGTFSNLLGIVLTPVLAGLLIGTNGGFSAGSLADIALLLLAPFAAGQALRRWIGGWTTRNKQVLGLVDRGAILLVVYSAFGRSVVDGVWHQLTPARLAVLLALEAVLLAVVLTVTASASRRLGFPREDRITIVFCGSKKSLASGLPMATVLFTGPSAGLIMLPLMLFHQMQLLVCAVLARRWAAQAQPVQG
ncbi:bile acid:sodium symporter family protein [Streptomyces kebangsaanensis]|uniref:Bile acid:sodium symporter family protein n=1 Tax=Streptomyces kebangsaanensis TaxID=864058 RepID=A0ABW6KXT2_9ACTN